IGDSRPGPMCTTRGDYIDEGTMCLSASPTPGPVCIANRPELASPPAEKVLLSPVFQVTVQVTDNLAAPMTWDSYWRMAYDRADKVLQAQANELRKRGNITNQEFEKLV